MPLISIIVPVYKVEQYLCRCVDSILAQTLSDFDLILIDDGSPDNCGTICDEYAAKDSRIQVIHQKNAGLSAARNAGIDWAFANSDSQWISFVDSDDWVHPVYLLTLYEAANRYGVKISVCTLLKTEKEEYLTLDREINPKLFSSEYVYTSGEKEIAAYACGRLFEKELFRDIRFPVGKLYEDLFTIHKVMLPVLQIAMIEDPLYYYYVNPDGITNTIVNKKRLDILEAYAELLQYLRQNGFMRVYRMAVHRYLHLLCHYRNRAVEQWNDSLLNKRIKNTIRELFFREWKECGITPRSHPECYNLLFPRLMWIYWGIKYRIERIKKNE